MYRVWKQMSKREYGMVLCGIVFIIVQVWLDLRMPEYMSAITRLVQTPGSKMQEILQNGAYMLFCAVGSMAAAMVTGYFAAKAASGLSKTVREKVFKAVMRFNSEEIGRFQTASLITRTTNDITQVQMFISMGMQSIIKAPILLVWAVLKISGKQWQWSLATADAVLIILIVLTVVITLALPKFKIIQQLTDNLNRVTRENLQGIRVVRAYCAENFQENKFEQANEKLTGTNLFASRVTALLMPTMGFVSSGISLAVYWIGAYLIEAADASARLAIFSDMVVFSSYAMQVIMAFAMLVMLFIMLPRVLVSARRIEEVLDTKTAMEDGKEGEGASDPAHRGWVEFRNVSFRYPDAGGDVLKNISFTVKPGETAALIGSTGSGKSTLAGLIPRFYDATGGEVLVDGRNVKEYTKKELRSKLGYVSQKAVLFSGTVESNVAFGTSEKQQPDRVKDAIRIAQAEEFVDKMEGGIGAHVAQGGTNLSGGQKQRLSIARALWRQADIYIFDDTFSALDYKTDHALRMALQKELASAAKLIVAQRIGTIRHADKIIVLDNGCVAGIGTHEELMRSCTIYQEIARSQLSEEELQHA